MTLQSNLYDYRSGVSGKMQGISIKCGLFLQKKGLVFRKGRDTFRMI